MSARIFSSAATKRAVDNKFNVKVMTESIFAGKFVSCDTLDYWIYNFYGFGSGFHGVLQRAEGSCE